MVNVGGPLAKFHEMNDKQPPPPDLMYISIINLYLSTDLIFHESFDVI